MSVAIALAYSDECAEELTALGFHKEEVYIKHVYVRGDSGTDVEATKELGHRTFMSMKSKPFQFIDAADYWGMGPD